MGAFGHIFASEVAGTRESRNIPQALVLDFPRPTHQYHGPKPKTYPMCSNRKSIQYTNAAKRLFEHCSELQPWSSGRIFSNLGVTLHGWVSTCQILHQVSRVPRARVGLRTYVSCCRQPSPCPGTSTASRLPRGVWKPSGLSYWVSDVLGHARHRFMRNRGRSNVDDS